MVSISSEREFQGTPPDFCHLKNTVLLQASIKDLSINLFSLDSFEHMGKTFWHWCFDATGNSDRPIARCPSGADSATLRAGAAFSVLESEVVPGLVEERVKQNFLSFLGSKLCEHI